MARRIGEGIVPGRKANATLPAPCAVPQCYRGQTALGGRGPFSKRRCNLVNACMAALSIACLLAGCGRDATEAVARLSGDVTLDGQPLPAKSLASVTFRPRSGGSGRPVTAQIIDGHYECELVPHGDVVAQMSISVPTGRSFKSERTGEMVDDLENVVLSADQSPGIALEVTGDANLNFELLRAQK